MNILDYFRKNKIDYRNILSGCELVNIPKEAPLHITIIPVRGRKDFIPAINNCFDKNKYPFAITEHSEYPECRSLCLELGVFYIWIPSNMDKFNKCLCFNIAALVFKESRYFMFHDVDIILSPSSMDLIYLNLKDNHAIQTFHNQRLLQANCELTEFVKTGCISFNSIHDKIPGLKPNKSGAVGGSILIKKDFFFDIGGYDSELFSEYSLEDQFFWDKMLLMGNVGFANGPVVEMIHLYHDFSKRFVKPLDHIAYHHWKYSDEWFRKEYITEKAKHLKSFL